MKFVQFCILLSCYVFTSNNKIQNRIYSQDELLIIPPWELPKELTLVNLSLVELVCFQNYYINTMFLMIPKIYLLYRGKSFYLLAESDSSSIHWDSWHSYVQEVRTTSSDPMIQLPDFVMCNECQLFIMFNNIPLISSPFVLLNPAIQPVISSRIIMCNMYNL